MKIEPIHQPSNIPKIKERNEGKVIKIDAEEEQ